MKTCIFLSKPRSGATVFRHALNTHDAVCDLGEVFNENNDESFFNFAARKIAEQASWCFPSRSIELFERYIDHCHELARQWKPTTEIVVLDIKYDHLHFIYKPWQIFGDQPTLLEVITKNHWALINLRRHNVLNVIISNTLAMRDQIYHLQKDAPVPYRSPIHLDVEKTLADCEAFIAEADNISKKFADYDHYLELTYENLFDEGGTVFSASALEAVARLLDIPNRFDPAPTLAKVVKGDPLDYVENREEIVNQLLPQLEQAAT